MKRKSMVVAIVALIALFVFLAGGFTKSETWHHDPCEQHSRKTQYDEWHKCITDVYYFEDSCDTPEEVFDERNNCEPVMAWLNDETMSYQKVVFDPRSTAMFVIGGLIITLTIRLRKAKREATSD